ncbi:RNA-directed DNA polymerase, eukaryota, reverse transcriptase zinc-binding domain protein [Tanacetum coccineum]
MWARFIKAVYGDHSHTDRLPKSSRPSAWLDIVCEVHRLKLQGIDLMDYNLKKVGNGVDTMFWKDPWMGDVPLKIQYPRLYALETIQDRWTWLLMGNGEFIVASVQNFLDDQKLPAVSEPTRWVKSIPIKINVFAWKVSLDKFLTRFNLSIRGMDINCILCPICEVQAETTDHLFFSCSMASTLLRKVDEIDEHSEKFDDLPLMVVQLRSAKVSISLVKRGRVCVCWNDKMICKFELIMYGFINGPWG